MSTPVPQDSQPKSVVPIFIGALIMFSVFAGLVLVIRSTIPEEGSNEEIVRAEARRENLKVLLELEAKELTKYSWIDKEAGTVRIPIDQAMALEIAALNEKKPAPAYPIVQTPAAPAAGADATDAAPADAGTTPAPPADASATAAPDAAAQPAAPAQPAIEAPAAPATETPAAPAEEPEPAVAPQTTEETQP